MTDPHRNTCAPVVACFAAGLLLAACTKSTPAPQSTPAAQTTSAVQTTAAATDATSVAATNAASTDATPAAAPSAGGTACTLVTEQEVGAALGTDPGPGSADTGEGGSSQCQYGTPQSAFVLVNLNPTQGKPFYDNTRNNPKLIQAGTVTDVAGVGDRAFGIFGHGTAAIYFNKGDALVLVMVEIRTATSPPKAPALALAKT